ncbi:MAG: TetR/AcrR family transcriptional regulator, partial [Myxococcales bacterium]|nr:TetR/AcrR family transcriptional regulator [Myxococcales bacterium]
MKSPIDSRARFVEATAELLRRQGYHATGLKQIVARSGAPRGSLYFHFPGGKEQLAEAALEHSGQQMHAELLALVDAASSLGEAIVAVAAALADRLEASEFLDGCPVATVALEAAARSPALQRACSASYARWQDLIEQRLPRWGVAPERAHAVANLVLCT